MSFKDLAYIMSNPAVMIASDSIPVPPDNKERGLTKFSFFRR